MTVPHLLRNIAHQSFVKVRLVAHVHNFNVSRWPRNGRPLTTKVLLSSKIVDSWIITTRVIDLTENSGLSDCAKNEFIYLVYLDWIISTLLEFHTEINFLLNEWWPIPHRAFMFLVLRWERAWIFDGLSRLLSFRSLFTIFEWQCQVIFLRHAEHNIDRRRMHCFITQFILSPNLFIY